MFLTLLKLITWFLTEKPSAPIVEEPTSEKIIMETEIEPVVQVREWSIDRIHYLSKSKNTGDYLNAIALSEEFDEWINIPEGTEKIPYFALQEEQEWGEQEIDTI